MNLVVNVGGPESSPSALVGVGGEERGGARPDLVDVLHDGDRLADGLTGVDEHRDLFVHRVRREEELALVP